MTEMARFHGVAAPAWGDDKALIEILRSQANSPNWDSVRNRALMLHAADRLEHAVNRTPWEAS